MASHFIYCDRFDRTQLLQGDVLKRDPELINVLQKYHGYYADRENYRYFIILTQSCDLIKRNDKPPSSPYITIAAVRPMEEALRREAKKHQEWWQEPERVIDEKIREKLIFFLNRLLNNNSPDYFYLHEELSFGIDGRSCAFLALSVAIKSEHYDLCLKAKIAQLTEEFSIKLGWLVGNMYSRVGTTEWDQHYGQGAADKEALNILKNNFVTFPKDTIREGIKELEKGKSLNEYAPKDIFDHIKATKIIPKSSQFKRRVGEVLSEKFPSQVKHIDKIVAALTEDAIIKSIVT